MKKIIYIVFITLSAFLLNGCEDFLDTKSLTQKDTANVPTSVKDAEQMLTGIYATFNEAIGDIDDTHFYMAELAADDRFGGGGENDMHMHGLDHFINTRPNRFGHFWETSYKAVYRANLAVQNMDKCVECSEDQKKQFWGEAYFLRALNYFQMVQVFGEVPLILETEAVNLPKNPAEEIYAQIGADLKQAIELMADKPYTSFASGHATKWAAEALMARVFLFYTGYYKKDTLPLAGGGTITKTEVINWLDDCIANSGHDLLSDYRNLWPYGNEFTSPDYKYAKDNNLKWAGDGNKETVFAIKFSIKALWDRNPNNGNYVGYANQYALHFGLRGPNGEAGTFPFGTGWGIGPVNSTLWTDWIKAEPNDIRRIASILNVNNTSEVSSYIWGADNQIEETGYWQKKYVPIRAYNEKEKDEEGKPKLDISYSVQKDGYKGGDYQLCNTQDLILIRFADVLLMHSELKQDPAGMNRVRVRAGLPTIGYSLDALKLERRWELSFEGQRYFDIMRWGDAPELLGKQEGVAIKNKGKDTVMKGFGGGYKKRYEDTGGFWPIPESQITLSGDVLTQNKGWGTAESEEPMW